MTRPYYVHYEDCTCDEPRPGWYCADDDGDLYGPYSDRETAYEAAQESMAEKRCEAALRAEEEAAERNLP